MSVHNTHRPLGGDLTKSAPADRATAADLIKGVEHWLVDRVELDGERRADITLATYEALANCVDHAYRGRDQPGTMSLQVCYDSATRTVRICITDHGRWMDADEASTHRNRGRGLRLMRALADDLSVDGRPDGTTVCLLFADMRRRATAAERTSDGAPSAPLTNSLWSLLHIA